MRTAFVDESEPGGGLDHTTYLMAAVIVAISDRQAARTAILAATPRRMRKLHWYEALPAQRVSWLDLLRHAVEVLLIRYDGPVARVERRRRHCLERLVWELEQRHVGEVVFETRGPARDRDDRSMLRALRDRGIGRAVRYEHAHASDETLLALADLACGAHSAGLDHGRPSATVVVP
ncbi:hypothetical protein NY588_15220 [Curtobacterium flaccumfaciens pv. beticola]|uniref:DUF3800 domain-containing protein n=1 Tax=Curtobacterium flaccumfaciens TaxID=2035 RepID=UPI00349F47AA|nr:hypothetical protein [Curtobacterium flaccumfaciens pv. basellae]